MSLLSRIRERITGRADQSSSGSGRDAESPDTHSTTGTTASDDHVGQPTGDDPGVDVEPPAENRRAGDPEFGDEADDGT